MEFPAKKPIPSEFRSNDDDVYQQLRYQWWRPATNRLLRSADFFGRLTRVSFEGRQLRERCDHVKQVDNSLMRKAMRVLDLAAATMAGAGIAIEIEGRRAASATSVVSPDVLVREHFATRSNLSHVNFKSLHEAISALGGRPSWIVETGSSAWGTDSSRLFDSYVETFGGRFWSVDLRLEPMLKLRKHMSKSSSMSCDDSVRFLKRWVDKYSSHRVDLVYLDSWDLDVGDPMPAAIHGLKEFLAIAPALRNGSLLLVDDTPASVDWLPALLREPAAEFQATHGLVPGKGMLIDLCLKGRPDVAKIGHRYQVLYRF